jgi:hypothetical protein
VNPKLKTANKTKRVARPKTPTKKKKTFFCLFASLVGVFGLSFWLG